MRTPASADGVTVRRATGADSAALLEWRNDPNTRAMSRDQEVVSSADHERWFQRSLESTDRDILIAVATISGDEIQLGTCRFDRVDDTTAEVSINLAPESRGRGIARVVLAESIRWLAEEHSSVQTIFAHIRTGNAASLHLFDAAGFVTHATEGDLRVLRLDLGAPTEPDDRECLGRGQW